MNDANMHAPHLITLIFTAFIAAIKNVKFTAIFHQSAIFFTCQKALYSLFSQSFVSSEGSGGMAGMAFAIPIFGN